MFRLRNAVKLKGYCLNVVAFFKAHTWTAVYGFIAWVQFPLCAHNFKLIRMSCLDNIISVRDYCSTERPTSLSGLDLMDAPELNQSRMAKMVDADFVKGYDLAKDVVRRSGIELTNDFLAVLAANRVSADIIEPVHKSSAFEATTVYPSADYERGFTLYKANVHKSRLKKVVISKVFINASTAADSNQIKIYDNGTITTFNVKVEIGLNEYEVNYTLSGDSARIVLAANSVNVYATKLICHVGCNGTVPNSCAYTKSWNNGSEISIKEGFGLGAEFHCECDFEQLICNMSRTYIGNLLYLKSRIKLLEEAIYSDRMNNFIVYGKDESKEHRSELINEYNSEWNTMVAALPNLLSKYNDDCLQCRSVTWKTNI